MQSDEVQLLKHILRKMTEPARRHKCSECPAIFECHLCCINDTYSLHKTHPFLCEECIDRLELHTVFVASEGSNRIWYEIDYLTGEVLNSYDVASRDNKTNYDVTSRLNKKLRRNVIKI